MSDDKVTDLDRARRAAKLREHIEARGGDVNKLPPQITEEGLRLTIDEYSEELHKLSYRLKKNYPADFKEFNRRLAELLNWLDNHKQSNTVIAASLMELGKELRTHQAHQDSAHISAERDGLLSEFGKTHCIVMYGGKVAVRREELNDWVPPGELAKYYSHLSVPNDAGKPENVVDAWMRSPHSRRYRQVRFNPTIDGHYDDTYNLWSGWRVKPEPGDDDLLWWDILSAACGYKPDYIDYTTKWFADIVQNPARKPGTAIGISGPQGVGKSALVETVGALMADLGGREVGGTIAGPYGDFSVEDLLSQYNEHVANKLLVFLDEATWGGSHAEAQMMKKIIVKEYDTINPKYLSRLTLPCYRREVFSSNNAFYYRPDKDDRRLLPLEYDTSVINAQSYEFWQQFYAARTTGKMLPNLLYRLQSIDLTGWSPIPALLQMTITTGGAMVDSAKQPWEHWLDEVAEEGIITIIDDTDRYKAKLELQVAGQTIRDKDLEAAFLLWAKEHRHNNCHWTIDAFKKERVRVLGQRVRATIDKRQVFVRHVPTCEQMQASRLDGQRFGQQQARDN